MTESHNAKYEVKSTDHAFALIKAMDGSVKQALKKAFEKKLQVDPEGYGTSLRGPLAGYYKHEVFGHRIVYRIYSDMLLVVVCFVGIRKQGDTEDVYNQLEPLLKAGRLADQIAGALKAYVPKPKAESESKDARHVPPKLRKKKSANVFKKTAHK
jgi:mRNA-degrading endonuclease RelE of RelBE toxin-antitoxin system